MQFISIAHTLMFVRVIIHFMSFTRDPLDSFPN